MVTVRKTQAGFTLTETMVVVVILSILAALSTPLLIRDNTARKGRDWAKIVAQTLQRARFQALGERTNIHVLVYRTHIDTYRQNDGRMMGSIPAPVADDATKTIAIWDANATQTEPKARKLENGTGAPDFANPPTNDIIFTPLGATNANSSWWIYIRNEFLEPNHPDASFLITVRGLTGHISSNQKVTLQ
jgi:prepilin-type N-terminal cleavage/methylation domain-containing protein